MANYAQYLVVSRVPGIAMHQINTNTVARLSDNQSSLSVDDDFETVWRRVGLGLDRAGYTIEARDRVNGQYDVRLPGDNGDKPKQGFWAGLFGAKDGGQAVVKHKVLVQAAGNKTNIQITDQNGGVQTTAIAQRIAKDLLNELN